MSDFEIIGIDRIRPHLDRKKVVEAVTKRSSSRRKVRCSRRCRGSSSSRSPTATATSNTATPPAPRPSRSRSRTDPGNPRRNLPTNHGLILVFNAKTGEPKVLFKDEGWMTAWRTAAATVIAAKALAPPKIEAVGIAGAGLQAGLTIEWLPEVMGPAARRSVGARPGQGRDARHRASGARPEVETVATIGEMLSKSNVVVTATPSHAALFQAGEVRPGTHIVAIGADTPGKIEVPEALFAKIRHVVADDVPQALDHGDFGAAVRAGAIAADRGVMLGDVLSGKVKLERSATDITLADLTGIAAEDIAISGLFSRVMGL